MLPQVQCILHMRRRPSAEMFLTSSTKQPFREVKAEMIYFVCRLFNKIKPIPVHIAEVVGNLKPRFIPAKRFRPFLALGVCTKIILMSGWAPSFCVACVFG